MLEEVAFKPEFSKSRIEKERKAVLAEAQMMNTIEYRVDCALLKYLHYENALGSRFPIGKTDQVILKTLLPMMYDSMCHSRQRKDRAKPFIVMQNQLCPPEEIAFDTRHVWC